jgi:hypothetical protein
MDDWSFCSSGNCGAICIPLGLVDREAGGGSRGRSAAIAARRADTRKLMAAGAARF